MTISAMAPPPCSPPSMSPPARGSASAWHVIATRIGSHPCARAMPRRPPLKKGCCGTMTHDYKRHGTTTLFAALDVATGKGIGQCLACHRHQDWLTSLRQSDAETPAAEEGVLRHHDA